MDTRGAATRGRFGALAAVLLLSALFPATALAQGGADGLPPTFQPKPPAPKSAPDTDATQAQIRVQSSLVTTPVTVIDSSGNLVYDLDQKDFQLFDNNIPQQITRFDIASQPISCVIVVQTTDSVASLLSQVRPLGPVFSDLLLAPSGEAAVISYSTNVKVLQDFSSDRDRLNATLQHLEAFGGKVRLNDALMQGLAMLETRQHTRRLMVLFGDGTDHGSENGKGDVVRRATTDGTTIYALHLSRVEAMLRDRPDQGQPMNPLDANMARPVAPGTLPTETNETNTYGTPVPGGDILGAAGSTLLSEFTGNLLELYAGYTGGAYYSHWSTTALQDQLNRVCSEVHSQYEIAYIPSDLTDTAFHQIRVRVDRPRLKVRARAGYFYQKQVAK